jgi:formylmethanofuran dehydrogenase subunit E
MQQRMMTLPVAEVFTVQPLSDRPPRGARVLESLECADCGERTMESRTRRFAGQTLCIPCYMKVEQKI